MCDCSQCVPYVREVQMRDLLQMWYFIQMCEFIQMCACALYARAMQMHEHGVATISSLLQNVGLFYRISSLL